jgi:hypothetical protein
VRWEEVSVIYEGDHSSETEIEFLPDGRMVCTVRIEVTISFFGHKDASTGVAVANPPYHRWDHVRSPVTRLDGPNLFEFGETIYAFGRRHCPGVRMGSFLGRKRTALYRVTDTGLTHLSDLPSAGDTGYAGLVARGDDLFVSYYTNDVEQDCRWVFGLFLPSEIRLARIHLPSLHMLGEKTLADSGR